MVDGFALDHKGKVSVFDPQNRAKDRVHADTGWMGSDDEVGATGERQQNTEQSDSGDQREEKGSCSSQRLWSNH